MNGIRIDHDSDAVPQQSAGKRSRNRSEEEQEPKTEDPPTTTRANGCAAASRVAAQARQPPMPATAAEPARAMMTLQERSLGTSSRKRAARTSAYLFRSRCN
jgi:hypothetical protein